MMKFRSFLLFSWILIIVVTWHAVNVLGFNWPIIFFGDLINHPWRSQFNTDFLIHLLLFGSWVVWREQSKSVGLFCGFWCVIGGGLFGFLYLLVTSYRAQGDINVFFLGKHSEST